METSQFRPITQCDGATAEAIYRAQPVDQIPPQSYELFQLIWTSWLIYVPALQVCGGVADTNRGRTLLSAGELAIHGTQWQRSEFT